MFTELINLALENLLFFALHLESGGVFPKPLSAAEEEECFRKMGEGDSAARNKLIEHNLRLVAHIIKKYYNVTTDQEDLISIGTIGLIKAVSTFDYAKKTRFATYASRCIENAIISYRNKANKMLQNMFPQQDVWLYILKIVTALQGAFFYMNTFLDLLPTTCRQILKRYRTSLDITE